MLIIPAVDIRKGRCVRLLQGRIDREIIYSDDPISMAQRWEELGSELIHVVDLDGAFDGRPMNMDIIKRMISSLRIQVQVGGGIRDLDTIEDYITSGVRRVILGTVASEDPGFVEDVCARFPGRIAVGIDAKDGYVAIKGWTEVTQEKVSIFVRRFNDIGITAIIYTDIKRDGMLVGPNIEGIKELASSTDIPVIASGGISGIGDIKRVLDIEEYGIIGTIVGKAIYDGTLDFQEAVKMVRGF
ncbi:MAG: 1-(5-phosphoribosyl)-5-[(5-phosphoribosylamino)methylideneamino]imidazole-4-carboxamide isomerase [Nitrospinae bacterium]|nr:1-(5-phosphoribosyl)-5-[(5-phosphoribosylamino)methylideneamino]imidazole-4-carboxamide isomerase [Nitrospinota bacterium]